ncbi:THO complex subunit 6 like protein [Ditylenchus destructor]|uniref:THO complex subunit 6 like protein n=1 Tax=Ditylenchus destructor TaxID=166010 RepID=A0AAD4MJZ0_9BILA|nr:THO complex subunit 6 like protein [Ditylenchus destructor]
MGLKRNDPRSIVGRCYTKIVDQCFSEDDKFGIALTSSDHLVAFTLPQNSTPGKSVSTRLDSSSLCIDSLGPNSIVCGDSNGNLRGFDVSALCDAARNGRAPNVANVVTEKCAASSINCILTMENSNKKLVGCGDGTVALLDMEQLAKPVMSFSGHTKRVNRLAKASENTFVSCSDDGVVFCWDSRTNKKPARTLQVGSHSKASRPGFSKHIYAVDVDDDFVVCGGGVNLAIWHLSSSNLAAVLIPGDDGNETHPEMWHSVEMVDGHINAGGAPLNNTAALHRFSYAGELVTSLKLNLNSINNIRTTSSVQKLTVISGESSEIFFMSDLGFISSSVDTFGDM